MEKTTAEAEPEPINVQPPSLEVLDDALEDLRGKIVRSFQGGTLTDGEKKQAIRLCREAGRLSALAEQLIDNRRARRGE